MKILQISDTHNQHRQLTDLPAADVIVHCGDFTDNGTEGEVLNFLNWFIELSYPHKIFITGNHDLCLWEAEGIEDLPNNVYFLQDCECEIDGIKFFGLAYNHSETLIPNDVDVLITHEPPIMILDESAGIHWGNALLRNKIYEVSHIIICSVMLMKDMVHSRMSTSFSQMGQYLMTTTTLAINLN